MNEPPEKRQRCSILCGDTDRKTNTPHESRDTVSQSFVERKSNNDKETDDEGLLDDCRLRHGLNEDCLCKIFSYLSLFDLIQLCDYNIYFQNLITNFVIGKKLLKFYDRDLQICWGTNKIFEVFGKTMRKIEITKECTAYSFERFLNLVIQCCAEGGLTEIDINFPPEMIPSANIAKSMPFFSKLRKAVLSDGQYGQFIAGISTVATNLTHLTLKNVIVTDEWTQAGGMDNLKELRLQIDCRNDKQTKLKNFLRKKSKLELFSYTGDEDIRSVFDTLNEHCPKLNTLIYYHAKNPYQQEDSISDSMKYHYDFLQQFDGLKVIGLTAYTKCGSDLYYALAALSRKKFAAKIEKIKFYIGIENAVVLRDRLDCTSETVHAFTGLKTIELVWANVSHRYDLGAEFILEFVSKLSSVEKLTLLCYSYPICGISKIIDLIPNISELNVMQINLKLLPVEIRKIVVAIRKRRALQISEGEQNPKPFPIEVNKQQYRELQVYKDIETICTIKVDKNEFTFGDYKQKLLQAKIVSCE